LLSKELILKDKLLVLASTSRYRRELLARLGLPFEAAAPEVNEWPLPGETPPALALRLAEAKARAVAARFPQALVIGSDQVADLDGTRVGKPGNHDNAVRQLRAMSGRTVTFHTAIALVDAESGRAQRALVPVEVTFRQLNDAQIEAYVRREQPYDCAGSAKSEGLGIALIASLRGDDPNALVGLPLIALVTLLANEGVAVV